MKIFNGHSDLLTDLHYERLKENSEVFRRKYFEDFKKGGVEGSIFVIWTDEAHQGDYKSWTDAMLDTAAREFQEQDDLLMQIRNYKDFVDAGEKDKIAIVLGMEGLAQIGEDIDMIDYYFHEKGVRHASLTWNEKNALASGPREEGGLTKKGKEAVRRMEKLGMILDISHLNDESAFDVLSTATGPVIASHSNARAMASHPRNLTDDLLKEVAKTGGFTGLNAATDFISDDKNKQTVEGLAEQAAYIANLVGVEHLALGFDFMEFLPIEAQGSMRAPKGETSTPAGLISEGDIPNLFQALRDKGFVEEEIVRLAWNNYDRLIRMILH